MVCVIQAFPVPSFGRTKKEQEVLINSRTIRVLEGNQFTVTLQGNSGTGYTWYIKEPCMDDYITPIAKHIIPCKHPGGVTTTIFKFHALHAGRERLVFEYARPWSWSVAQHRMCDVVIEPRMSH